MDSGILISNALDCFHLKFKSLDPNSIDISEHSRSSLLRFKEDFNFFISSYSQLLKIALDKLNHPADKSVFVDYGGGCGILSFLAKEAGFKTVIYNDINKNTAIDAEIISKEIGIYIDHFISGDSDDFVSSMELLNISPDLICAFDVAEHIYDLEKWILTMNRLPDPQYLLMTGANPHNPIISFRLKKLHAISENQGCENNIRCGDKYLNTSFLEERGIIIKNAFPQLKETEVFLLALKTRGLRKMDIEQVAHDYLDTGEINYKMDHPTNTCDPYTGSWTERLLDLKRLKSFCENNNMEIEITNTKYCYSDKIMMDIVKYFVNQMIKVLGPHNLFFSPGVSIAIKKARYDNL